MLNAFFKALLKSHTAHSRDDWMNEEERQEKDMSQRKWLTDWLTDCVSFKEDWIEGEKDEDEDDDEE